MAYEWDIFISYRRVPLIADWTHRVFLPTLRNWLPQFHPQARIFIDIDEDPAVAGLPPGSEWAPSLKKALKSSRCLVPILSAEYFDSPWCLAEFHTMLRRQKLTGAPLILPIRFADGSFYAPEAKKLQLLDFEPFNTYRRQTQTSQAFVQRVQGACTLLHTQLAGVPKWSKRWPVVHPKPKTTRAHVPKPGF